MARTVSEQFGALWNVSESELHTRAATLTGGRYSVELERLSIRDYNGCFDTLSILKAASPVIVTLEDVPEEVKNELMDFLCGAAFALDAGIERVRPGSYLFAPNGCHVSDDDIWHAMYR